MAKDQVSRDKLANYAARIDALIEEEQSTSASIPDQLSPIGDVSQTRVNTLRNVRYILYEEFPYLKK